MSVRADTSSKAPRTRKGVTERRRLHYLLGLLLLIGSAAGWVWFAPHFQERRIQNASLAELRTWAAHDSGNERILYALAVREEQSGHARTAMEGYWHALQLDQDDEAGWLGWARSTQVVLGDSAAIEVLKTCLKRNPDSAPINVMLARLYQESGDHQSAYDTARKATTLTPTDGSLWQLMGTAAAKSDKPVEAETAFRQAIACVPGDWRNHAGLGDALSHLKRRPEAIAAFRETVRLAPELGVAHLLLGTELLASATSDSEVEAARGELLLARKQENTLPGTARFQVALLLGQSYKRQQRWQDAISCFRQAEPLSPLDPAVSYSLMECYRALGDDAAMEKAAARHKQLDAYDHELKTTRDHLVVAPDDLQARLKLARLYGSQGLVAQSVQAYRELLARAPNMAVAQQELQTLLESSRPPASHP